MDSLEQETRNIITKLQEMGASQQELDEIELLAQKRRYRIYRAKFNEKKREQITGNIYKSPQRVLETIFSQHPDPIDLGDTLFTHMIQQHQPVASGLNFGREAESVGRGIQMCHGKIYENRAPPFLVGEDITWLTSNKRRDEQPDFILDVFSKGGYDETQLGLYEYVMETNCSGGSDPINFLNYLYNVRHIMTKGSKCIIPYDTIFNIYRLGYKVIENLDHYMAFRQRMIDRLLEFCDYSMFDLVDASGQSVPPQTSYEDGLYTIYRV